MIWNAKPVGLHPVDLDKNVGNVYFRSHGLEVHARRRVPRACAKRGWGGWCHYFRGRDAIVPESGIEIQSGFFPYVQKPIKIRVLNVGARDDCSPRETILRTLHLCLDRRIACGEIIVERVIVPVRALCADERIRYFLRAAAVAVDSERFGEFACRAADDLGHLSVSAG